jgi:hypothetical protein
MTSLQNPQTTSDRQFLYDRTALVFLPYIADRWCKQNDSMTDGTPRREKGFRPYVETRGPDLHPVLFVLQKRIWIGPLFATEAEANEWTPVMADIAYLGPMPVTPHTPGHAARQEDDDA